MTFEEFVTWYYNKKRRNGQPWTVETIAEDSGWAVSEINTLMAWATEQGPLTDADLVTRFNTTVKMVRTPFGLVLQHVAAPAAAGSLDDFITRLRALIAEFGR